MIFNLSGGGGGDSEAKIIVTIPTVTVGTYTYDGTAQGPTIGTYDTSKIIVRDATKTDAGTYTLTLALRNTNKMVWTDLTTADKTWSYTIGKMPLSVPGVSGSYTYDRTQKQASVGAYDSNYITQGGDVEGTAAGTYTVTFDLVDPDNTKWSDGTVSQKTRTWSIAVRPITVPSVSGSFTYDTTQKSATISTFDTAYITQGGDDTGTNAGTYTVTFNLADTTNTEWSGGGTGQKTGTWTIGQATGALSLSKSTVSLNTSKTSDTIMVTITGDGTVTAASSDTSVATVSKSGNTFTINSVNNKTGTATIAFTLAATTNYTGDSKTASVTAQFVSIYGVEWDGTSTTKWSRTDASASFVDPSPAVGNGTGSSPFDNLMPWSGMVKSNRTGGVMVSIPKFWYKWTITSNAHKLQISDAEQTGFSVAPAFMDRGDGVGERDIVYVGRYHCHTSDYKSKTGGKPKASITRSAARTAIHNLGANIWQLDYAMLVTIWMLYLVEYADWNSQKVIGYGCGNNSSTENMGSTDAMTYHTGTNASSRTTYGHTQYRYIEDLWGNVYDWVDGIYFSSSTVYAIKNPANFSDSSGGTNVGTRPTSSNYISAWKFSTASGFGWFLYPSAVSGSESTYVCDYCDYYSSGVVLRVGGSYYQGQACGLFYLYGDGSASYSDDYIGSRLQELPSAA